jgi:hypothetical protein
VPVHAGIGRFGDYAPSRICISHKSPIFEWYLTKILLLLAVSDTRKKRDADDNWCVQLIEREGETI